MATEDLLKKIKNKIIPEKKELEILSKNTRKIVDMLEKYILNEGLSIEVFVGGSFAKGTLLKGEEYEIDILLRFDIKHYNEMSKLSEKITRKLSDNLGVKIEKIRGSRDYFRLFLNDEKIIFEIVPVLKIKNPSKAENVTDLSYFHVSYVKKNGAKFKEQIILAKAFCIANEVYGAEGYIRGFTGYAIELLIIYYKSFIKMLNNLVRVKKGEKLIIDIEKKYKNNNVLLDMNESRTKGPIVLIDPTFRERNALAALSYETFEKFKKCSIDFLKRPSVKVFEKKSLKINLLKNKARKNKAELVKVIIKTNKQPGDIAGTKLYKFFSFLINKIKSDFDLIEHHFNYDKKYSAEIYLIARLKKDRIATGPPSNMKKYVDMFKKTHRKTFEIDGRLYSKINTKIKLEEAIKNISNQKQLSDMSIIKLKIDNIE